MKKTGKFILILTILSLFFTAGCSSSSMYDNFAKCLTQEGVKFYGAFWCPHCAAQKQLFGSSIKYVNYIECSSPDGKSQLPVCINAKIKGYPTFEFADSSRLEGEQSLEILAKKTGCVLPS